MGAAGRYSRVESSEEGVVEKGQWREVRAENQSRGEVSQMGGEEHSGQDVGEASRVLLVQNRDPRPSSGRQGAEHQTLIQDG